MYYISSTLNRCISITMFQNAGTPNADYLTLCANYVLLSFLCGTSCVLMVHFIRSTVAFKVFKIAGTCKRYLNTKCRGKFSWDPIKIWYAFCIWLLYKIFLCSTFEYTELYRILFKLFVHLLKLLIKFRMENYSLNWVHPLPNCITQDCSED